MIESVPTKKNSNRLYKNSFQGILENFQRLRGHRILFLSRNAGRRLNPTKASILKTCSTRNDFLKILKIQQMLFEGPLTK